MADIIEHSWSIPYNSSILDFIINDDKENDKVMSEKHLRRVETVPHVKIPPKSSLSDDLLDFLASEELITRTPTSVTFRSIEDPLPSYDENFSTLTNNSSGEMETLKNTLRAPVCVAKKQDSSSRLAPANKTSLKPSVTPFSPSDVLNKIKKEMKDHEEVSPIESDPVLNFNSLKNVSPLKQEVKQEPNIDEFFQRENSMSISLDDVSTMMSPEHSLLDSLSPVSPASSEGSTDTLQSSGVSDVEMSPRRGGAITTLKKTRRRKVTEGGSCPHLWQFILELLGDKAHCQVISWTGVEFHFKVHNSRELARLWGARKNKPRMNFDKLSRAMRYYYDKNIIRHITGQRLVYEFCRNVDDAVYTKLLTDAARTMPQKPVTLPCSTTTHCSPPSYTPFPEAQQETTKFVTALQNYTHQSAEQQHSPPLQSYFRETSYAQLYHTALYHSTERYVARGDESAAQQHYIAQQTMDRQHIPYIPNYVTAGHVQTTHTSPGYVHVGGFKKEKVDYSFAHYAPY